MKDNILIEVKLFIVALFASVTAWLGILAIPLYILVILNIIDYFTGVTAAPYRGEKRSSDKGFRGIAKKICMWLLVAVGGLVDWLIMYMTQTMGITIPFKYLIGAAVAVWLICNEVISIMENIDDIGVEVPSFLRKLMEWVRKTTEDKTDIEGKSNGK